MAEEISWRQKSGALWLEERDFNLNFFHRVVVVEVDGEVQVGKEEVEGAIAHFYKYLFKEEEVMSGLKVDLKKYEIILVSEVDNNDLLAQCYRKIGKAPKKIYLGFGRRDKKTSFGRIGESDYSRKLGRLLALLHQHCEPVDRLDSLKCKLGSDWVFSDKSFYEKILVREVEDFAIKSILITKVTRKCPNGHALCEYYQSKVLACPICCHEPGNIRCLALEKIESLELPCQYQFYGCQDIFPYHRRLQHEQNCRYRPYNCPYAESECAVTGDIHKLNAHLKDHHKVDMHDGCVFNHRYDIPNPQEVDNAAWMLRVSSLSPSVLMCIFSYICSYEGIRQ
ncbi:putative E3 ubiquitin-protein ligase SINAT1 [Capsicum baccatum]|uniref:RING-type E3 ubiquitin transferase n=1 Tax=Capsicum baccatum TaxID=33114 RepID=A0A2G2XN70_CAPBA|nr:putative E3 ubiquitin-protein ligase SINAT1 [Capsicum baccatum]